MSSKSRKLAISDKHPLSKGIKRLDDQYSAWIAAYACTSADEAKEVVLIVTGDSAKFIEPIIGKPGLYYSRLTGMSWAETLFDIAVLEDVKMFLYRLFASDDKPLHPRVYNALRELAAIDSSLLSTKQMIALDSHLRWFERRDTMRSAILFRKELMAFYE